MPLVNMTIQQLMAVLMKDEFAREQFGGYIGMLRRNKGFTALWKTQHPEEIKEFQDYGTIFNAFRSSLANNVSSQYSIVRNIN